MDLKQSQDSLQALAAKIRLLLLDVDGVLTDGRLYFSNSGEEMKAFSTLDGHGIKMLLAIGVNVGIITGRTSDLVKKRCADLGVSLLLQGREDKLTALNEILAETGLMPEQVAFAGDDLPDLPVLRAVGLGFSVPAGHHDVKSAAAAITDAPGGMGAVREITDFIIKAQGRYVEFID